MPTMFIVYSVLVHCRVGSLENLQADTSRSMPVHCRVGSLENQIFHLAPVPGVHCRVGSLEKTGTRLVLN